MVWQAAGDGKTREWVEHFLREVPDNYVVP